LRILAAKTLTALYIEKSDSLVNESVIADGGKTGTAKKTQKKSPSASKTAVNGIHALNGNGSVQNGAGKEINGGKAKKSTAAPRNKKAGVVSGSSPSLHFPLFLCQGRGV